MTLGHYSTRSRYRERAFRRFNRGFLILVLGAGCIAGGFFIGRQNSEARIESLQKETADQEKLVKNLQSENTSLRATARTASSRLNLLKLQYEKDFPQDGPTHEVYDLVKKQLDSGIPAERLVSILQAAQPPRNCTDPVSKRFMVKTPAYKGAESSVSVGEGVITITGSGISSKNREGQLQSWFDPTQSVTLNFKKSDGTIEEKSGVLPLQHTMVVDAKEYRFTMTEGERSFLKVTFDSCDYP